MSTMALPMQSTSKSVMQVSGCTDWSELNL
jgi:hypothetical protein